MKTLNTQIRWWWSPLSWCFCYDGHCHAKGEHYWLASSSTIRQSPLQPHERGFKRQTLGLWRKSENCIDKMAQRTISRILRGKNTFSYSNVEKYFWEKWWQCWEVGMLFTEDQFPLMYNTCFYVGSYSCTKGKYINFDSPTFVKCVYVLKN